MSRIITALIVLPVLIASILISWLAPLFVALALTAMVLGLYEFWLLAKRRGIKPDVVTGFTGAAAIFTIFYLDRPAEAPFLLLLVLPGLTIIALVAMMLRGAPFDNMIASAGATLLGVMYVALLGGHLVAVRMGFEPRLSAHLLSFFFLVIMGSDSGAYYTGRAFGKHKLAPQISPGKTWEGAIGGMLTSLLMAVAAHYWFFPELPLKYALPLAALMYILGPSGGADEYPGRARRFDGERAQARRGRERCGADSSRPRRPARPAR
jgi:phosphatidate cytidylyltransferase